MVALQAAGKICRLNWRSSKAELKNVKNIFPLSGWIIRGAAGTFSGV